jgi:Kef-type K+ transport system membrane component KefB
MDVQSLERLLLQISVITIASAAIGALFRLIHQPKVLGEMVAGILLGPSLMVLIAPRLSNDLFPRNGIANLAALSQVGLLLFMFQLGLDLDLSRIRTLGRSVILLSIVSTVFPFGLGATLALHLHATLAAPNVGFLPFALFVGTAMSLTAFPVLSRILIENQLLGTVVGTVAVACAAIGDVTGWCLLAFATTLARTGDERGALLPILLLGLYVAAMLLIVKPAVNLWASRGYGEGYELISSLLIMTGSAWLTARIGIHTLFGAFFAGIIMPRRNQLKKIRAISSGSVISAVLLPLFFAYSGLRTNCLTIGRSNTWILATGIIIIAVLGKLGGSTVVARIMGMTWPQALTFGSLMNTRGLIEIVVLNVGLDLHIISVELFSMMILMALITTFMTTPLLHAIRARPVSTDFTRLN